MKVSELQRALADMNPDEDVFIEVQLSQGLQFADSTMGARQDSTVIAPVASVDGHYPCLLTAQATVTLDIRVTPDYVSGM